MIRISRSDVRTPSASCCASAGEELGLDLDAIGEALRIKPVFLAALEQGRTEDLPGPTYAIGFVRAYAHYLGFDSERVLDVYRGRSGRRA